MKETGNLKYIYRNELDKDCFAYDAAHSNNKDLAKRTVSDTILNNRAYEIAINSKDNGYQRGLASRLYKFFNKKTGLGASVNKGLAQK